jgi:type IV pilus biogenesis protein PilP
MPRLPNAPFIRTSLLALMIAMVFAVSAFVRAVRIPPVDAIRTTADAELLRVTSTPPVPGVDIDAIGENDIFQPNRKGLPSRYRMPGESGPTIATGPDPARPIVLGTVIATDGGHFATCQLPGGRAVIVHVGDRLGEYTVEAIERDKVVFKSKGRALLEITALRPGQPSEALAPITTNDAPTTDITATRAAMKTAKKPPAI